MIQNIKTRKVDTRDKRWWLHENAKTIWNALKISKRSVDDGCVEGAMWKTRDRSTGVKEKKGRAALEWGSQGLTGQQHLLPYKWEPNGWWTQEYTPGCRRMICIVVSKPLELVNKTRAKSLRPFYPLLCTTVSHLCWMNQRCLRCTAVCTAGVWDGI